MPLQFFCPSCKAALAVAVRKAGEQMHCPGCRGPLVVPLRSDPRWHPGQRPTFREPANRKPVLVAGLILAAGLTGYLGLARPWSPSPERQAGLAYHSSPRPREAKARESASLARPSASPGTRPAEPPPVAEAAPASEVRWSPKRVEPVQAVRGPVRSSSPKKATSPAPKKQAPAPVAQPDPAKPVDPLPVHLKRRNEATEEELRKQLEQVPELALDAVPQTSAEIFRKAQEEQKANKSRKNDVGAERILEVVRQRPDLAGLPLRRGKACRLDARTARQRQSYANDLRRYFADLETSARRRQNGQDNLSAELYNRYHSPAYNGRYRPEAAAVVPQILMSDKKEYRRRMVEFLGSNPNKEAGIALAQRALFDLDPDIRLLAVEILKERPVKEYRDVLVDGLRYPWSPVADHAAEALAALRLREVVPQLVLLLEEGDPSFIVHDKGSGRLELQVREVVRVNHFRNCLLCHAPSVNSRDLLRGPVPDPGRPLPPFLSPQYYTSRGSGAVVRADITYLRQDFAVCQPVANPGKWPANQRSDYFVRVRPPTLEETALYLLRSASGKPVSAEHQAAVLFALRELTGKDLGGSPQAWRKYHHLDQPAAAPLGH